jgi:hypothetical protein
MPNWATTTITAIGHPNAVEAFIQLLPESDDCFVFDLSRTTPEIESAGNEKLVRGASTTNRYTLSLWEHSFTYWKAFFPFWTLTDHLIASGKNLQFIVSEEGGELYYARNDDGVASQVKLFFKMPEFDDPTLSLHQILKRLGKDYLEHFEPIEIDRNLHEVLSKRVGGIERVFLSLWEDSVLKRKKRKATTAT